MDLRADKALAFSITGGFAWAMRTVRPFDSSVRYHGKQI
jgi:hypothetical protein